MAHKVCIGDWQKAKWVLGSKDHIQKAFAKAVFAEAKIYFKMVRETLQKSKGMEKLSPFTMYGRARRTPGAGSKPLRETNELYQSVTCGPTANPTTFFVGILNGTFGYDGRSRQWDMVKLAELHEFGGKIVIDTRSLSDDKRKKMYAYLWIMLRETGAFSPSSGKWSKRKAFQKFNDLTRSPGVFVIRIPARPFLTNTFDEYMKTKSAAQARVEASVMNSLQKIFNFHWVASGPVS